MMVTGLGMIAEVEAELSYSIYWCSYRSNFFFLHALCSAYADHNIAPSIRGFLS